MNDDTAPEMNVNKLYIPLGLFISIIVIFGAIITAVLDRDSGVRADVSKLDSKVKIIESNVGRIEDDVISCQTDIRDSDRVVIEMRTNLEYLVKKVDEISVDIKEHKKATGD